jgi:peroxiredoxin
MVTKICLITCVLSLGQLADRAGWALAPRLAPGQELVYRGTFTERSLIPGAQHESAYRLEATLFVMEALAPERWQVAFLTALTPRSGLPEPGKAGQPAPSSVRLDLAEVDGRGRLRASPAGSLAVPLAGLPTAECGGVVELPAGRVAVGSSWPVAEAGRPPRTWRVAGTEVVNSTACVKLVGDQQSPDWEQGRADSTAWWRRDTVWVAPQFGIAYRVEREIRRRDPARAQPTYQSVTRYELDGRTTWPGKLFEDRRYEVQQARRFFAEALPLLANPVLYQPQLDTLLRKITFHLEDHPATPYRQAVLQVQHRIEAARRGEVVVAHTGADESPQAAPAALGHRAPDFLATDLLKKETVRLYQFRGRPVLLVFFNPGTETGRKVLGFAKDLAAREKGLTVLGLSMAEDEALVRREHDALHLSFPILDGRGLHVTFGVSATPWMVLLDGQGVVRGTYTGWGLPTPGEVREGLGQVLHRAGTH